MGHCGKFGYTLWATAGDLVMHYGPLRGMRSYSKNLWRFLHYGPLRKIWLCAMGHSPGFGYPLWAVAKDLVKGYGPWRSIWLCAIGHSEKPITIALNYATVFNSLPYPLKGQWCPKKVYVYKQYYWGPTPPKIYIPGICKKNWFPAVAHSAVQISNSKNTANSKQNLKKK